jgi:hypothetical protein
MTPNFAATTNDFLGIRQVHSVEALFPRIREYVTDPAR